MNIPTPSATNPITYWRENSAMAADPVRIRTVFSRNLSKQVKYDVICHFHRVHTTVTAKPSVVRRWIRRAVWHNRHLLRHGGLVVGLGVQWTPGSSAATLQLCEGHNCLIFQLLHAAYCPRSLRRFLAHPNVIFVGLWNRRDAELLGTSHHRLRISPPVDVRDPARDLRGCRRNASMEALAEEVLGMDGVRREEAVGRSQWGVRLLSKKQVQYACIDVFISLLMAKALRVWEWV